MIAATRVSCTNSNVEEQSGAQKTARSRPPPRNRKRNVALSQSRAGRTRPAEAEDAGDPAFVAKMAEAEGRTQQLLQTMLDSARLRPQCSEEHEDENVILVSREARDAHSEARDIHPEAQEDPAAVARRIR